MKRAILLIVALVAICLMMVFYMVSDADGSKWVEDAWEEQDDSGASSSGDWGTEVEIEYEDGTNETLKTVAESLSIKHDGKNVSKFKYKLSSKGASSQLTSCSLDLSSFYVNGAVTSGDDSVWDADVSYGTNKGLPLDGEWYEVYIITIEADDLSSLSDGEYKLDFIPGGTIRYRGKPSSDWVNIKDMPGSCWLTFDVDNFWITIEFEGGMG